MASRKNIHVVPHQDKWANVRESAQRISSLHDTQEAAYNAARETARRERGEVFTHNRKGQIVDRDSYGNDPCPPLDKKH